MCMPSASLASRPCAECVVFISYEQGDTYNYGTFWWLFAVVLQGSFNSCCTNAALRVALFK